MASLQKFERNVEIRRRRFEGEPLISLASEYGLSRQRIHQISNRPLTGRERDKETARDLSHCQIRVLVNGSFAYEDLEKMYGFSRDEIDRIVEVEGEWEKADRIAIQEEQERENWWMRRLGFGETEIYFTDWRHRLWPDTARYIHPRKRVSGLGYLGD